MKRSRMGIALAALTLVAAACGGGEAIEVDSPWARTSPNMTSAGAVYMNLTATETDSLVGASVDSSIAGMVEVHEVVAEGDAMKMQQVSAIDLPAGETISLEPGGYHIMLLELAAPLETGQTFDVTLQFSAADDLTVEVEVREEAP